MKTLHGARLKFGLIALAAIGVVIAPTPSAQFASFQYCLPINLSQSATAQSTHPQLAVSPESEVVVVWQETMSGNDEILAQRIVVDPACLSSFPTESGVNSPGAAANVSANDGASQRPDVLYNPKTQGNNEEVADAFVIWQDDTPLTTDQGDRDAILFRGVLLPDNGVQVLPDTLNLSERPGIDSKAPMIAKDRIGTMYAVWQEHSPFADNIVFHNDRPFAPKVNLSRRQSDLSVAPRLATSPDAQNIGRVYVVWEGIETDRFGGPTRIFLSQTDNARGNYDIVQFTDPTIISLGEEHAHAPDIAIDTVNGEDIRYVVWYQATAVNHGKNEEIILRKAPDIFNTLINVSGHCDQLGGVNGSPGASRHPAIALFNGEVYLAWEEDVNPLSEPNREIQLTRVDFQNTPFDCFNASDKINLSQSKSGSPLDSKNVAIATDDQHIYLVWEEVSLEGSDVYFMLLRP